MTSTRHIAAWIVGGGYTLLGLGIALVGIERAGAGNAHTLGWIALILALVGAAGTIVNRRHPVLSAGLIVTGALIPAGVGALFAGFVAAFSSDSSTANVIFAMAVAGLAVASPALLTGAALIRGRRELRCD